MQTKTHLTFPERERIEFHRRLGRGVREIGRRLRRDHGVISRELRRDGKEGARYTARTAAAAEARRRGRRSGRKLERDPRLHEHVIRELRGGRSPDVMSGRMKLLPVPGLRGKTVSRESICRYVYGGEGRHGGLFRLLPCRRARRQTRGTGRSRQRSRIQERISIHARPEEVMGRMAFGHWESDTVICPRRGAVLSVQVERASRLPRFHRAPAKTAEDTERAIRRSVESLPSGAFRTMAFDDGTGGGRGIRPYGTGTAYPPTSATPTPRGRGGRSRTSAASSGVTFQGRKISPSCQTEGSARSGRGSTTRLGSVSDTVRPTRWPDNTYERWCIASLKSWASGDKKAPT